MNKFSAKVWNDCDITDSPVMRTVKYVHFQKL